MLILLAVPILVRAVPASDEKVTAAVLLARIRASDAVAFSGVVESVGSLALPVSDDFAGLAKLVGGRTRMRAWWLNRDDWRVSTLRTTGETGLFHHGDGTTRWVYESKRVTRTPDVPIRLPNSYDVLPNVLARRVLSGARRPELHRLPATRVAGRDALGLRLTPADQQSSIGHVDVFADRETGLPLRISLYGATGRPPWLSTTFLDLTLERPSLENITFSPPPDAELHYDDVIDIAAAADRFANRVPPRELAGLRSRGHHDVGSVGLYGRGPTLLIAIPLWDRAAGPLREQLTSRPGAVESHGATSIASGPLRLLLAEPDLSGGSWLLAGTVTHRALLRAADELSTNPPGFR